MARTTDLLDQLPELASMVADQAGTVTRTVLRLHGIDDEVVRRQVTACRWQEAGPQIVVTFTGPLPVGTRRWAAATNAGPYAVLSGRTALTVHGLDCWGSDQVQVVGPSLRIFRAGEVDGRCREGRRCAGTRRNGSRG